MGKEADKFEAGMRKLKIAAYDTTQSNKARETFVCPAAPFADPLPQKSAFGRSQAFRCEPVAERGGRAPASIGGFLHAWSDFGSRLVSRFIIHVANFPPHSVARSISSMETASTAISSLPATLSKTANTTYFSLLNKYPAQ